MSDYTLEVVLADLPRGWAVAAIGEGKPVAAPPPVLDEIKRLRAERDELLADFARVQSGEAIPGVFAKQMDALRAERDEARADHTDARQQLHGVTMSLEDATAALSEAKRLQETERQRADAYSYRMKLLDVELFEARAQLKAAQEHNEQISDALAEKVGVPYIVPELVAARAERDEARASLERMTQQALAEWRARDRWMAALRWAAESPVCNISHTDALLDEDKFEDLIAAWDEFQKASGVEC